MSKTTINELEVLFDSKLQWCPHIDEVIHKAIKALNTIKLIRKFCNLAKPVSIVTKRSKFCKFFKNMPRPS
jgi:hypothetical protein